MVDIFKYVDKFFTSLTNYLTYNYIFVIFVGLFLFTALCVIFFTSRSYEARLIKAIDKFNVYFIDNPQINEENLVAFNAKMKDKKVPKQLRKNWQQFVLYREDKASAYMSFENCVANPIKNSTYTRDVKSMNTLAWIFSLCSLLLNVFYCFETTDVAAVFRGVFLTPIIILLLNYIVQIFLNLRHSAIVSDLFQNYQYFEVNIDKATETLPEYVDYEVLFDRNEIKKGIPILYAYLQKRAEEEQRELERARLKNVEHEKFNFDDQGVAASLVLERAMQEAENYIAERKKYVQDIAQINSDMTQEDMNYREITKEYNRQMQVSKETFANFKSQLEDVSSTIEANYLKKQQQQELDRQRNLERDFDTATERHKKVIESYQAELDTVDKFIAQSRKALEDAMKNEFSSYSSKVYDEAKKVVDERQKDKLDKLKQDIANLEENLIAKNQELDHVYEQNQIMSDKLEEIGIAVNEQPGYSSSFKQNEPSSNEVKYEEPIETLNEEVIQEEPEVIEVPQEENINLQEEKEELFEEPAFEQEENEDQEIISVQDEEENEKVEENIEEETFEQEPEEEFNSLEEPEEDDGFEDEWLAKLRSLTEESDEDDDLSEEISTEQTDDSIKEVKPVSRRGRPRKVVTEQALTEKKRPGRPKKVESAKVEEPKRAVGRPRKEQIVEVKEEKRGRGRPKKVAEPIKRPGRPKKVEIEKPVVKENKKGRGRPKKEQVEEKPVKLVKKGRGRPRKQAVAQVEKRAVGRPKKAETVVAKSGRGRPKKQVQDIKDIKDIDAYLKEIDNAIAAENAKLQETQKELAKNAKLKRKK